MILGAGGLIAAVNGANDVSKGVATLVGAGLATERRAIAWGAAWTAVGAVFGAIFASALVTTFGKGLLAAEARPSLSAAVAVIAGAAAWVSTATRTGLPVSTTHAIVGSMMGVAAIAYGPSAVRWEALGAKIALPLLASPLVAFVATAVVLRLAARLRRRAEPPVDCVCVDTATPIQVVGGVALASTSLEVTVARHAECAVERPHAVRMTLDHIHWLTSAGVSLARAMNDAPKIAALVIAAAATAAPGELSSAQAFGAVTIAMVAGSLLGGRRVLRTLATKLTRVDHGGGFAANAVAAALVTAGAVAGLPMSTTHVTAGGILGSAAGNRQTIQRGPFRDMLLSWVVTVPCAGAFGCAVYVVARTVVS